MKRGAKNTTRHHPPPYRKQNKSTRLERDPFEILMDEHARTLRNVTQLRLAARLIRTEGFSFMAYGQISESIRFIGSETRRHDQKEEKYLIPVLARHAADLPRMMRYEHRELWSAFDQLATVVNDVSDGTIHGTCIRDLVDASTAVADLLTRHIEKENTLFLPMARKLLTRDEYRQLGRILNTASSADPRQSKQLKGKA